MENRLLTVTELADALDVDRSTVHRRIGRGQIVPFAYVGNRPVFLEADVDGIRRGAKITRDSLAADLDAGRITLAEFHSRLDAFGNTPGERMKRWGMDHAFARGAVVCAGHLDYCADFGHAAWTVDGVDQGMCARCGGRAERVSPLVTCCECGLAVDGVKRRQCPNCLEPLPLPVMAASA